MKLTREQMLLADRMAKFLVDQGKLLEAGFQILRNSLPPGTTEDQINEARLYYFAGCEHVWHSIMTIMDEDKEPTAQDLRRMASIQVEIDEARKALELRFFN